MRGWLSIIIHYVGEHHAWNVTSRTFEFYYTYKCTAYISFAFFGCLCFRLVGTRPFLHQHDYSLLLQYNSMPNCYAVTFYYRRVIYFFPLKKVWNLLSIFFMLSTSYRYTNQTYVFMYLKHNTKNYNFLLFLYLFYFIKIYVHFKKIRESFNEKIHQKC